MRALGVPWPVEESARRYRAARRPFGARRYHALRLRKKGLGVAEAAEAVGATTETLRVWIKRGVAERLGSLAARTAGSVSRPKLDAARRGPVLARADAEPRDHPRAAAADRRGAGIGLSETQVWVLVRGRGLNRAVPRKRPYRPDPARLAAAEKT